MLNFLLLLPIALFAITIHEYSHGMVAYKLGDKTAYLQGRLTLNPLKHLDPIGTFMLIIFHFGWAKPVPVNPINFRQPKRDMMLVGIAGPLANIGSAFIFGLALRFIMNYNIQLSKFNYALLAWVIILNLALAIFNLLPIFPLDGAHILNGLLPPNLSYKYSLFNRKGTIILLGIVILGRVTQIDIIGSIIWPPVILLAQLFSGINLFSYI